jgi:ADP-glucose pyrophosphorylase
MHCHNKIEDQKQFHSGMTISSHMFDRVDDLVTTVIGDNVVMYKCIVDENVHVGPESRIINVNKVQEGGKSGSFVIQDGIIHLTRNCTLPEGTVI